MRRNFKILPQFGLACCILSLLAAPPALAELDFGKEIPVKTIAVDGNPTDWDGVEPFYTDPAGDSTCGQGSDIEAVYLATDGTNLYWRMDTYSNTFTAVSDDSGPNISVGQNVVTSQADLTSGDLESRAWTSGNHMQEGKIWVYDGTTWDNEEYSDPEYWEIGEVTEGAIPLSLLNGSVFSVLGASYHGGSDQSCDHIALAGDTGGSGGGSSGGCFLGCLGR